MPMPDHLVLSSEHSFEDKLIAVITPIGELSFAETAGMVCISVAEEQAIDSYNQLIACSIHLNTDQAKQLRDWLIRNVR